MCRIEREREREREIKEGRRWKAETPRKRTTFGAVSIMREFKLNVSKAKAIRQSARQRSKRVDAFPLLIRSTRNPRRLAANFELPTLFCRRNFPLRRARLLSPSPRLSSSSNESRGIPRSPTRSRCLNLPKCRSPLLGEI